MQGHTTAHWTSEQGMDGNAAASCVSFVQMSMQWHRPHEHNCIFATNLCCANVVFVIMWLKDELQALWGTVQEAASGADWGALQSGRLQLPADAIRAAYEQGIYAKPASLEMRVGVMEH